MQNIVRKIVLVNLVLLMNIGFSFGQKSDTVVTTKLTSMTLNDANKINKNPVLEDTVYNIPQFEYKIIETKLPTPFKVEPITPAKLIGDPLDKLYSNYVSIGMGNKITPYFEYFHGKQRSKDILYSIHAKHLSSSGVIKDYAFPGFSNNLIEGNFTKMWKSSEINSELSYNRNAFHFYGFKEKDFPDSLNFPSDKDNLQVFNIVNGKVKFHSRELPKSKFDYLIGLDYTMLSDNLKNTEQNILLDFEALWKIKLSKELEDQKLGIEGDFNYFSNKFDTLEDLNNFILTIRPVFKFKYSALSASLGINTEVVKEDSTTVMEFSPDLNFKIEAIEKILIFNLSLKGGAVRNNLYELTGLNPFLAANIPLEYSTNKLGLKFGVSSSISKAINVDAQLFFNKWEHAPFFITDTNELFKNKFTVEYDNYELTHLQAGISYKKNEKYKILFEGHFYMYNTENLLYAWYKPNLDLRILANYNIQDKFILRAEIIANGSCYGAVLKDSIITETKIDPWMDANLGIEYRYNKKLGFFLNINNLTASNYSRWYNYPSFRFNVLAGFSFIF